MKTTNYTYENLSKLNGTTYSTGHFGSAKMLINNGACTVEGKAYPSLNAALNRICEIEHRAKNSLRAKHMWDEDGWLNLEEDVQIIMEEEAKAARKAAEEEAARKAEEEKANSKEGKINKIAETEINLVKEIFGIETPTQVKNAYVKILDVIFDLMPSAF